MGLQLQLETQDHVGFWEITSDGLFGLEKYDVTSFANGNNFNTHFPLNLTPLTLPYSKLEATASLTCFKITFLKIF